MNFLFEFVGILVIFPLTALAVPGFKFIVSWGENLADRRISNANKWEPSLRSLCSNAPHFSTVHIHGITSHYGWKRFPGMSFGNHCSTRAGGEAQKSIPHPLLQCPAIGHEIQFCQRKGVKVLITVANVSSFVLDSEEDGIDRANMIWNLFLGGQDPNRPFGDVILDGVNIFIRDHGAGYLAYAKHLRYLMNESKRKYFLTLSPQASLNDAFSSSKFSSQNVLSAPEIFDSLVLYALSSPDCTWGKQTEFWDCMRGWVEWARTMKAKDVPELYLALPANNKAVIGSSEDYASIDSLLQRKFYAKMSQKFYSQYFKGIMILDYSLDRISKPCQESKKTYSQMFYSMMQGNAIQCTPEKKEDLSEQDDLNPSIDREKADCPDKDGDFHQEGDWDYDGGDSFYGGNKRKFHDFNWGDSSSAGRGIHELRLSYFVIVILACLLF